MSKNRPLRWAVAGSALAVTVLFQVSCSSSSSDSTPTQPDNAPLAVSDASVSGQIAAGGAPAGGIRVTVDGLSASATSDASGRFALSGIGAGDRVFRFESRSTSAAGTLPAIKAGEHINVKVAISGSSATLTPVTNSDDPTGDDTGTTGKPNTGTLHVDPSPSDWDLCDITGEGKLQLKVRGQGFADIDPTSLTLTGDDPAATPIAPSRARLEGEHLKATFAQKDAAALLLQPLAAGETRTFTLNFLDLGVPTSLTFGINLVQPDPTCAGGDEGDTEDQSSEGD